jgi:hypothetical protein
MACADIEGLAEKEGMNVPHKLCLAGIAVQHLRPHDNPLFTTTLAPQSAKADFVLS